MLRHTIYLLAALAVWLCLPHSTQAHFVWVRAVAGPSGPTCEAYFSEAPIPGESHLVDRLQRGRAWARSADGQTHDLALTEALSGDTGCGTAELSGVDCAVEMHCPYGVFERGGQRMWLEYFAKALPADAHARAALARNESFQLDLVPEDASTGLKLGVLWQGQPLPSAEVIVARLPDGEPQTLQSDASGVVEVPGSADGLYARVRHAVPDQAGEHEGQAYQGAVFICTLTFAAAPAEQAAASAAVEELSAAELLAQAREHRAIWNDFPGFASALRVETSAGVAEGRIVVDAGGGVELQGFDGFNTEEVLPRLRSLVSHRFDSGAADTDVSYVAEEGFSPAGRLIRFDHDEELKSAYRIRDDVISEVNRQAGDSKFRISVLDVYRNPEGRYLPSVYQVSFWSVESSALTASETHENTWVRHGQFDLPENVFVLRATPAGTTTLRIAFSEHELASPAAATSQASQ